MGDDIEIPSAEVRRLPVRYRKPPEGEPPVLKVVDRFSGTCSHTTMFTGGQTRHATYEIVQGETEVTCSLCQTRLDPMWVLVQLARQESVLRQRAEGYSAVANAAKERTRTKCEHCDRFTRIKGLRP